MNRIQAWPVRLHPSASRMWLVRAICVCVIVSFASTPLYGQEAAGTAETMKARLKREIQAIPELVADGALTQEQGTQALTQLKVKLADLYLNETEVTSSPTAQVVQQAAQTNVAAGRNRFAPPADKSTNSDEAKCVDHCYDTRFIAGVEQSGYSAQVNNTNLFVDAFFRDYFHDDSGHALWGRIRLLTAPQPSTEGIVSTLTDPTGKITQSGFSQVGQVVDFMVGTEYRIPKFGEWNKTKLSLITAIGATTPLNSKTVVVTYKVPDAKTAECEQLVGRFGQNSGYTPYLVADPSQNACIYNPVTKSPYNFVSFSNQDRSNFLLKWSVGFRLEHDFTEIVEKKQAALAGSADKKKDFGTLDLVFGQDETVTGGKLSGWLFKAEGLYPLTRTKSAVYVFGSAAMRFQGNNNLTPLILTVPQAGTIPAIPSTSVMVLPLKQPNRDFYRIGIGLNLVDVFKKLLPDTNKNDADANTAGGKTENAASDSGGGRRQQ